MLIHQEVFHIRNLQEKLYPQLKFSLPFIDIIYKKEKTQKHIINSLFLSVITSLISVF